MTRAIIESSIRKLPLENHNELSIMEDSYPKHQGQHDREEKRIMGVSFTSVFRRTTLVALIVALVGSAVQVTPVYAASIVVTSNADTIANDGVCTLREALFAAQQNAPTGGCRAGSGTDTISFFGNYTITLAGSELPAIQSPVIIQGNGAANTIIQANVSPNAATDRVFQVGPLGNLTLDGLTVRHGYCTFSCTSLGGLYANYGGGIYNAGTLTVKNSIISGNSAVGAGGIFGANDTGTLTITNSTISGNSTSFSDGAGLLSLGGTIIVTNSTFSGNIAHEDGGGAICNGGTLTVTNSTVSGNTGFGAGGICNFGSATVILKNTIVANNTGGNCAGAIVNAGYNLDSGSTCGFGSNNFSMSNTNPKLSSLANNGGPTQTMALLAGSPAIDTGNASFCSSSPVNGVDQRGVTRPKGAGCDIGAYEYNGTFWDVPLNYWAWDYVERLYAAGITGGCATSPLQYCPEATVTRAQMSIFLLRGIHGSSYNPPPVGSSTGFADVPTTYWAAAWIKQLAAEGITGGCGSGNYCPETPVTRSQMAIFLLRAKHGSSYNPPPVGSSTGFADVPTTYWAAAWIKQLAAEGITGGCGSGNYCPETPVNRAQMSVFLVRTFNLP
jgi:CSLREA domain-containing protein